MPRALERPCVTSALNAHPLSLWRLLRRPKQGIISVIKTQTTSLGCSVLQGKASTHPVNVSTNTSGNLDLDTPGI